MQRGLSPETCSSVFIALWLLWFADRAALPTMEESSPQRPVLPLRQVLVLEPSGFRQLPARIRVTHPHVIEAGGWPCCGATFALFSYRRTVSSLQNILERFLCGSGLHPAAGHDAKASSATTYSACGHANSIINVSGSLRSQRISASSAVVLFTAEFAECEHAELAEESGLAANPMSELIR